MPITRLRPSSIWAQGLVNREVAACATDHIEDGSGVNELEAVAECIPFANYRTNDHWPKRKHELQLQNLAQRHFERQHRRDPGFADVNGITHQPTARPRINRDVNFEFEPEMSAGLDAVRIHRAKVPPQRDVRTRREPIEDQSITKSTICVYISGGSFTFAPDRNFGEF